MENPVNISLGNNTLNLYLSVKMSLRQSSGEKSSQLDLLPPDWSEVLFLTVRQSGGVESFFSRKSSGPLTCL